MLIPYNVDRPARNLPVVTYSLMAINIFVFFVTVFISNVNLPADRIIAQREAVQVLTENANDPTVKSAIEIAKGLDPDIETNGISFNNATGDSDAESSSRGMGVFGQKEGKARARQILQLAATRVAYEKSNSRAGYQRAWQIQYMNSTYVLTPHYSVLEWFAYRPGDSSVIHKLMGLVGSMFLHGGFEHILGNMFFLWIFGRAVEDSLGTRVYLGAYLLCGIAATLLHHIISQLFDPAGMQVPVLGASGAIAGVMGLFAPRFYRTPVRVFYLLPTALIAGGFAFAVLFFLGAFLLGDPIFAAVAAVGGVLAGLYYFGRTWAWGAFKAPAAWFLGFYVVYFDLYPAVMSLIVTDAGDGTAHWAHIGGFLFGMLYAFLIGSQKEGKQEFLLEDAEKAYNLGDMAGAITFSQNILAREPGNPNAYEVTAKAFMKQNSENEALDNFELAIRGYLRTAQRQKAAAAYLIALEKYPSFILAPAEQLALGNQMAKDFDYKNAAETLVKIPYTFPDAGEGEVALLRSAQLYVQHLGQPQTGLQLLQFFWQKFPESQWMPQVERTWKMAEHQLKAPQQPVVGEVSAPGGQSLELEPRRTQKAPPAR